VGLGDKGCLSIYGRDPSKHRLLAEHLTSEYRIRTEGRGRVVDEWKLRPESPDNHWLDGLSGCAVAASILGCQLSGIGQLQEKTKPRLKLSELQKQRRSKI